MGDESGRDSLTRTSSEDPPNLAIARNPWLDHVVLDADDWPHELGEDGILSQDPLLATLPSWVGFSPACLPFEQALYFTDQSP